jgi:hypothetical protein
MLCSPLKYLKTPAEHLITIDFETYYDPPRYGLKSHTTEGYVRHPEFETIGVGVKVDDHKSIWLEGWEFAAWAKGVDWARYAVLAHHAHFDGLILSHHYGIRPGFWFDTLSMARALHGTMVGGSLAKLSTYYGVGAKGDEVVKAMGKRRADFTPQEHWQYGEYCKNDCDLERAILLCMLGEGFPEGELWVIDSTIRMFTEPELVLDQAMLAQELIDVRARKAALLERVELQREDLLSNPKFAALLMELGVDPPTKESPATGKETWAFAKSDPGMKALLDHPVDEVRWLAEARVGVKSTLNETRAARYLTCAQNGPAPVYLNYAAAHTFRFGGGDKMNWQNNERPSKKHPTKGRIRMATGCAPGYVIVVADSGAIEARKVAWFSGHKELVAAFAEKGGKGRDVYSEAASKFYGRKVDRKLELPDGSKPDESPGHVGKVAVLGLGYGMGYKKFGSTLLSGPMGADPITFTRTDAERMGVDVTAFCAECLEEIEDIPSRLGLEEKVAHWAVAKMIVERWRAENGPIVKLWKECETVIGAMLEGRVGSFGPGGCVGIVRHGLVLPSGLVMKYPGLEWSRDRGFTYLGGYAKERKKLYGGLLCENVTQALARQVVTEQMLHLRGQFGYLAKLSTHDELGFPVREEEAPLALERTLTIMKQAPEWAPGLPVYAEGGFAKRYGEAK